MRSGQWRASKHRSEALKVRAKWLLTAAWNKQGKLSSIFVSFELSGADTCEFSVCGIFKCLNLEVKEEFHSNEGFTHITPTAPRILTAQCEWTIMSSWAAPLTVNEMLTLWTAHLQCTGCNMGSGIRLILSIKSLRHRETKSAKSYDINVLFCPKTEATQTTTTEMSKYSFW